MIHINPEYDQNQDSSVHLNTISNNVLLTYHRFLSALIESIVIDSILSQNIESLNSGTCFMSSERPAKIGLTERLLLYRSW